MFHSHVGCSSDRGSIKYTHFHVSRWYACRRIIAVSENTVLVRKVWRWGWCWWCDYQKKFCNQKKNSCKKSSFSVITKMNSGLCSCIHASDCEIMGSSTFHFLGDKTNKSSSIFVPCFMGPGSGNVQIFRIFL